VFFFYLLISLTCASWILGASVMSCHQCPGVLIYYHWQYLFQNIAKPRYIDWCEFSCVAYN